MNKHSTLTTQSAVSTSLRGLFGIALAAAALALAGCGSSSDDANPQGKSEGKLQCGSSALFAAKHDVCDAMDAKAVGEGDSHCLCLMGYAWNGKECVSLGDCQCEGADCDKLSQTVEECQQKHASCTKQPASTECGNSKLYSLKHEVCEAMDAKAIPDAVNGACFCMLGFAWNGTECVSLANCACEGKDCDKLTQTIEDCQQKHASCTKKPASVECGNDKLYSLKHEVCEAMDAKAVPDAVNGACFCMLGFAWNGTECVSLANCACEGKDCDKLTQTIEECQQEHTSCKKQSPYTCGSAALYAFQHDVCAPMDAQGQDACFCGLMGYKWNGKECEELFGVCTCVGEDCGKLTKTLQECQTAHATCN